jgi:hypothetical protein
MLASPVPGALTAVVLVAGGVFALAGLWMMLRLRDRPVRAATAFLAGVGFLLLPWIAGDRRVAEAPPMPDPELAAGITLSADRQRTVAVAPSAPGPEAGPPPPLPGRVAARIEIEAAEAEPNDTLAGANRAAFGISITGTLADGDHDYFTVEVPAGLEGEIVASLVVQEASASLTLFDDAGRALGTAPTFEQISVRTTFVERRIDGPRYYVLVTAPSEADAAYQLTIAARSGRWGSP